MGKVNLLEDIQYISKALKNAPNGDYEIKLRSEDTQQVIETAESMNVFLYHPCESKPYYWFIYKANSNNPLKKIVITVRGSYI